MTAGSATAHDEVTGDGTAVTPLPAYLRDRVARLLAESGGRVLLGITGTPGAGKSTLAQSVVDHANRSGTPAVWVPMDGFHLADVQLDRLGLRERKGAIDTFDGHGYVALLRRLLTETANPVYAPAFDRVLEQPVAGSIAIDPETRLVVTEGNYLLDELEPWARTRALLAESWFCDVSADERRRRLVARHVEFGKSPAQASAWVTEVDERNAGRIARTRDRADLVVTTETPTRGTAHR